MLTIIKNDLHETCDIYISIFTNIIKITELKCKFALYKIAYFQYFIIHIQ